VTTYVSPNVERILGYTPEEIIGVPSWWLDHVAPEDRTRLNEQAAQAGADRAPQWSIDVRFPRRDGAEQWIAAVVNPDYDEQGARTGGTVYCWDITEQRRAQEALGRSERFLDSVIENLPDMVFVKDARELRFVRMNRAGEELLGYPREALIGKNDYDFFPPEQATFFTAKDREVLQGGRVVDIPEEPIDTSRQGQRILHTKKIPLHDAAGRPEYLLGISEDVTERKWAEAEVIAARTEAERANLAKSEFLSRMSHELRTPLNAILGFAQLLELDSLSSDQRESVTHIGRAGRHLLELINEVLDISRIETGQMTISPEPVAIADLLGELVALIGPLADGRSITIGATRAGCDVHVLADRQRLKQVLLNLLGNAVKYNREGGSVTVACAVVEGDRLRISVTDTGYGVRPDQLERLFQPFERLGAEGSEVEGTGMGLALSKGLVEAMGGRIGVESELDRGTTFWVELGLVEGPLETYENGRPDEEPSVAPSADRTHKVLHIEDNLSNLTLVERILGRRPDIELLSAMQGQLGIDLARQHRPDVILLDLHLPDTSGREVLRRLRTYPETRDTPVVIVSADATKTQIARLTADGATGYLTKPLDVKAFIELIDTVLGDLPPDGP
jgi:PAS domain S-box-containing protein